MVLLKEIERVISLLHTQSITEPVPEKLHITYPYTLFYLYIWFLLETKIVLRVGDAGTKEFTQLPHFDTMLLYPVQDYDGPFNFFL